MFAFTGPEFGGQFVAGWVTEYSLSIDNLFVFIIIMARFSVPRKYQQEVLMVGIIIALLLRGIFILLGAIVIEQFSWVFYIFGAFLLWTAWKQAHGRGRGRGRGKENPLIARIRRVLPMSEKFDGGKLRTVVDGKKVFTPMLIVFVTIGMTDLLFAVDSIPAIFGLTQSAFIVFTANIFALMGLRQLYFLLGGLMNRLVYLKHALSVILALHRRQAGPPRHARERAALHQRRPAHRVGARDPHLRVARGDRRHHRGRRGRQPAQPGSAAGEDRCPAGRGQQSGLRRRRVEVPTVRAEVHENTGFRALRAG